MFSVLIPSLYAFSVHGIWIGLVVFVITGIAVFVLNMWYMARLANADEERLTREITPNSPLKRLVTYRTLLATVVCVLIAITSGPKCQIDSEGVEHCRMWGEE